MRVFEPNRYKANRTCPCGKDNRKGKFATERGFAGQYVGKCFACDKNFYQDNDVLSTLDRQTNIQRPIVRVFTCCLARIANTATGNVAGMAPSI